MSLHPSQCEDNSFLVRAISTQRLVSKKVLHSIFLSGTSRRPRQMSLFEFCDTKHIPLIKFKHSLTTDQIERIKRCPDGISFDIPLLYHCIRWVNDRVAHRNDDLWKEGNDSLESHITAVKARSDNSFQNMTVLEWQALQMELSDIKRHLTETIKLASMRYDIPEGRVIKEVSDINIEFIFDNQDFVRNRCRSVLSKVYTSWHSTNPTAFLAGFNFEVEISCFEMVLPACSKSKVTFENLFKDSICQSVDDPVILLEGEAGIGKTTLLRKILCDWSTNQNTGKYLSSYDILLYIDIRDNEIYAFSDLIMGQMYGRTSTSHDNVFVELILQMKILIIMDGLEGLNDSSTALLREIILKKKENCSITLLLASQPELPSAYLNLLNSLEFTVKVVNLCGIPQDQRHTVVTQYHSEMVSRGLCRQNVGPLLEYLNRNEDHTTQNFWKYPYKLMLLVILGANNASAIKLITSAIDFYWQVYLLTLDKMSFLVSGCGAPGQCPRKLGTEQLNEFVCMIGEEAITGLKNNDHILCPGPYRELESVCKSKELPCKEIISGFLRIEDLKTQREHERNISFPDQGFQEFFGALSIYLKLLRGHNSVDVGITSDYAEEIINNSHQDKATEIATVQERNNMLDYHKEMTMLFEEALNKDSSTRATDTSPRTVSDDSMDIDQEMEMYFQQALSNKSSGATLQKIHENEHGKTIEVSQGHDALLASKSRSSEYDKTCRSVSEFSISMGNYSTAFRGIQQVIKLSLKEAGKYQNLLIMLLGLMCREENNINDSLKKEVLDLLGKTGSNDRHIWMYLLHTIRCDNFVATYIWMQPRMLHRITDSSLFEYNSLLQSLDIVPKNATDLSSSIDINSNSFLIPNVLEQIVRLKMRVKELCLHYYYRNPASAFEFGSVVNLVLNRCKVDKYIGPVTSDMDLPGTIKTLAARITNASSYLPLERFIRDRPTMRFDICVPPYMESLYLRPVCDCSCGIFIPDVNEDDVDKIAEIARRLQPSVGMRKLRCVTLPRTSLSTDCQVLLLQKLKGIKLQLLGFPDAPVPPQAEKGALLKLASEEVGCRIEWNGYLTPWDPETRKKFPQ